MAVAACTREQFRAVFFKHQERLVMGGMVDPMLDDLEFVLQQRCTHAEYDRGWCAEMSCNNYVMRHPEPQQGTEQISRGGR